MKEKDVALVILTALDDIAWLYNLRGSDIEYNPVFFSFAAITETDCVLFINDNKIDKERLKEGKHIIKLQKYNEIHPYLSDWIKDNKGTVWLSKLSNYALYSLVPEDRIFDDVSPVQLMKLIKNPTEIKGMKNCHIRDGAAVCRYLHWLEMEVPKGNINEISGSDQLETFRREQDEFVGLSFPTISAVGGNGSTIHYQSSAETNTLITTTDLYLVDSGAQFIDGTTDITRTVHFGDPSQYEKIS